MTFILIDCRRSFLDFSLFSQILFLYLKLCLNKFEKMNVLSSAEEIDLIKMVDDKIHLGNQLQKRFEPFIHIDGAIKIQKKISREIKYLEKVRSTERNLHLIANVKI